MIACPGVRAGVALEGGEFLGAAGVFAEAGFGGEALVHELLADLAELPAFFAALVFPAVEPDLFGGFGVRGEHPTLRR